MTGSGFLGNLAFMWDILPDLLKGLWITLELSALSLVAGLALAIPIALARTYTRGPLNWLATVFVEIFRGTPLLVQLFIIHYGLPEVGIVFDRMMSAWLALALNSAAYQSEYLRGAILAVPAGQLTAARSLGMTAAASFRHVVLPQALRLVIPAWTNEVAYMVKYVSVVYLIAVPELFSRAQTIIGRTFKVIPVLIETALIYLVVLFVVIKLLDYVEHRFRIPGLESGGGRREL